MRINFHIAIKIFSRNFQLSHLWGINKIIFYVQAHIHVEQDHHHHGLVGKHILTGTTIQSNPGILRQMPSESLSFVQKRGIRQEDKQTLLLMILCVSVYVCVCILCGEE